MSIHPNSELLQSSPTLNAPNLFAYLDYREYLRDQIEFLKSQGRYSVRGFARKVGLGSPNYLQLVIRGDRNLGTKFISRLSEALGHTKNESIFFQALIKFNSATDPVEKDHLFRRLLRFKAFKEVRRLSAHEYEIFSDWRNIALYEGLATEWSKKSPETMSQELGISKEELDRRFRMLESLNMIREENGKWVKVDVAIDTEPQIQNLNIRNFHRQMLQKALEAVDNLSPAERSLGSMTLPLTEKTFRHIERRLNQLRAEIASLHSAEAGAENVYQLNIQLFPLLRR